MALNTSLLPQPVVFVNEIICISACLKRLMDYQTIKLLGRTKQSYVPIVGIIFPQILIFRVKISHVGNYRLSLLIRLVYLYYLIWINDKDDEKKNYSILIW
jgi:hypothetical protein